MLCRAMGFVREGLRREDCIVDGEVSDSWIYGLLRREWKSHVTGPHA
jgi:[ribosomal protein S5]-alanine N-acetyltransferase